VPTELAHDAVDGSPFACALLLPAMRLHEDLEIDGPVSPRLVRGAAVAREVYLDWCPELHPARVRVAEELAPRARADGVGCFFSRGVDSTYSAARPRADAPLTQLLFVDRLEPRHDESVRAEEIRRAQLVADRLGLPLAVMESNLRSLTDEIVRDWEDMAGAGLAFVANCLAGGLGRAVIPSTDGPLIGPCGTSPLLDPLFSTDAVEIHHDSATKSRVEKVLWLARERPELLKELKVCFEENRPDNCGRCSKCLVTMVALEAAGALELADQFPPLDKAALDVLRQEPLREWTWYGEAVEHLDPERHAELRELILAGVDRWLATPPAPPPDHSPAFRRRGGATLRLVTSQALSRAHAAGLRARRWRGLPRRGRRS
jgi:hypothetical protein